MGWHFPLSSRQYLYKYLQKHEGEALTNRKIADDTWQKTETVSKNLKYFERLGVIKRIGKEIWLSENL